MTFARRMSLNTSCSGCAFGTTQEEAQRIQNELLLQQHALTSEGEGLRSQSSTAAQAILKQGAEITDQTTSQITAAQAVELQRLQAAKTSRTRTILFALVGSGVAVGAFLLLISKQNK
jgi:hypothetical protein